MPFKKPVIQISGLVAGLLLFLALLAVQLNNAFFNSDFQQSAIDRLDFYERVLAPTDAASRESTNTLFETAVKNSITPDLFNRNIKSLVEGLIDFVSGRTTKLPDLYIADAGKLSIASSAGVTPAAVEKINLQLLMMFSDEQYLNDVLSVISLVQFLLSYLPLFSLLLLAALVIAVSKRSPACILDWTLNAASSFFILSWLAALCLGSVPWLLSLSGISSASAGKVLLDYIRYCTGRISEDVLFSGFIIFVGYEIALYTYEHFYLASTNANFASRAEDRSWTYPKRALSLLLISTLVYSATALILVENADGVYNKRNLGNAVSYIMGSISYNSYTDARDDDVCLLNLSIVNGNTKTPVPDLKAAVYPLAAEDKVISPDENGKQGVVEKTDNRGTASFLLFKGEFRLELDPTASSFSGNQDYAIPLSYDFSLAAPGRTDLTVTLGSDPAAAPAAAVITGSAITDSSKDVSRALDSLYTSDLRILDASMQYIP